MSINVDGINNSLGEIQASLKTLSDKLEPILKPAQPSVATNLERKVLLISPLGLKLEDISLTISSILYAINDITERVDS